MTEDGRKSTPHPQVIAVLVIAACMSAFTSIAGFGISISSSSNNVWGKLFVCRVAIICCFLAVPSLLLVVCFSRRVLALIVCAESAVILAGVYVANWHNGLGVRTVWYPVRIAAETLWFIPALVPLGAAGLVVYAYRLELRKIRQRT